MSDLWFTPAYELAERIRSRALSPVELMEACLARIEAVNPALNAFIALRPEQALAEARATADRVARGEEPGPLAGLPAGLQIVAPRHREDLVLQASYAYERERPWNDHWPREIKTVEGE